MEYNNGLRSKKNAEAMLQMAEELSQEIQGNPEPGYMDEDLNQMKNEETINMRERQQLEEERRMREQVKSRLPMGPKYLEALEHVTTVADIRSIETELPILKVKVEVTPLTGKEEQILKTAAVSPEGFLKKLDEILFNHTKFENAEFASYNDFLANLFPPDKQVIIWALLTASYLVLPTLEKQCDSCGENYMIDASPDELIHEDTIKKVWDKELPPSEERNIQTALNGYITFEIGLPSERDKLVIAKLLNPEKAKEEAAQSGQLLSYTDNLIFFTKTIAVGEKGDRIVMTDLIQDIAPFLRNLPPKVADAVKTQIDLDVYNDYMPRFYLDTVCSHCGHKEQIDIDPEMAFFRKTISL